MKEGFEQGDKGVHILDGPEHAQHVRRMQGADIDVAGAQRVRQLEILRWEETYLVGGRFEQYAMIDTLLGSLQSGLADGFRRQLTGLLEPDRP